MEMSQDHKDALALGRKQARAIKGYLKAIEGRKPGRPVTKETLEGRLTSVQEKIALSDDPLKRVDLIQAKLDIEKAIADIGDAEDFEMLEKGFVDHAKAYSDRKGISYTAWREIGVPATVLRSAGIAETRRR